MNIGIRLYELSNEYQFLLDNLYDNETGVVDETTLVKLDELKEPIEDKCKNIVRIFKNLDAERKAIEAERKAMQAREKALSNQVKFLNDYLRENMEKCQISKIECPQFVISLKKNPQSVEVIDESSIPAEYVKIITEINKEKLRRDLLDGKEIQGAQLIQRNRVDIR